MITLLIWLACHTRHLSHVDVRTIVLYRISKRNNNKRKEKKKKKKKEKKKKKKKKTMLLLDESMDIYKCCDEIEIRLDMTPDYSFHLKNRWSLFLSVAIYPIHFKFVGNIGNENMHIIYEEIKCQPDRTTVCWVMCLKWHILLCFIRKRFINHRFWYQFYQNR